MGEEDNLVHADASPDLSQSGQQTSVQTGKTITCLQQHFPEMVESILEKYNCGIGAMIYPKTEDELGQLLGEMFLVGMLIGQRQAEKAADAVIEECAKIADNGGLPFPENCAARIIAKSIRSLKSPGRVVDRNAPGCDGGSLETKSFLAKEDADGNG